MTLVWPTQRQALEWVFIGLFVLAACLLLVPRGNAASVRVPPGQLWTCHVAEAEADMMSGPEMKEGESCDMHEGENDPNNPKKEL